MEPIADRSQPEETDVESVMAARPPAITDVPSAMASHIGELYAEEERQSRHERTELMIKRAESF